MATVKSIGTTPTEQMLASLCDRSFLQLWSYANPFKDDSHELCDVLAVFENHVFIFFDREIGLTDLADATEKNPQVLWSRWVRKVIEAQIKSAHGAERYLRSGRDVYLDAKLKTAFPINIDRQLMIVHKIIVAHGAKEACESFSDANVYGSLAICYGDDVGQSPFPFMIHLDKSRPVHILDSHNLPIILGELDTVSDFSAYLVAKEKAVTKLDLLLYCGEEDLLAHYYFNIDNETKKHFIGVKDSSVNAVSLGEGDWKQFVELDLYKNTKRENEISYFWDQLLQRTCGNSLNGTLTGNSDLLRGRSPIHEMAKEPRFMRRALSTGILQAVRDFPEGEGIRRHVKLMGSYFPDKAYVFLQLDVGPEGRREPNYREKRQRILQIACAAAKNKFPRLQSIIGIAIDPPKFVSEIGEDFLLMDCTSWTDELSAEYEDVNKDWGFFCSDSLKATPVHMSEFVPKSPDKEQSP